MLTRPAERLASSYMPIESHLTYQSIIRSKDAAGTPGGMDEIVPQKSRHLTGTASEKIIRATLGSARSDPSGVREVRCILRDHLCM